MLMLKCHPQHKHLRMHLCFCSWNQCATQTFESKQLSPLGLVMFTSCTHDVRVLNCKLMGACRIAGVSMNKPSQLCKHICPWWLEWCRKHFCSSPSFKNMVTMFESAITVKTVSESTWVCTTVPTHQCPTGLPPHLLHVASTLCLVLTCVIQVKTLTAKVSVLEYDLEEAVAARDISHSQVCLVLYTQHSVGTRQLLWLAT